MLRRGLERVDDAGQLVGPQRQGLVIRIEPALGEQVDDRCVERFYRDADLVISTPGGFLNGHYDIANTLRGFELATRVGKPLILFGQSIGPFGTTSERTAVARALAGAALIAVRDSISLQHLAECGITADRTRSISDVALLWRRLAPSLYVAKSGQVPFTAYQTRWCACVSTLLDDLDTIRGSLPAALDHAADRVWRGLRQLDQFIR